MGMKVLKSFKRKCPSCNREINYQTNSGFWLGNKKNSRCKSCATSGINNAMFGKTGAQNPFYGKHHTPEQKAKWSKQLIGRKLSQEHAAKIIEFGKKNIIQGNVYDFWLEKYGKEEADRRLAVTKAKHSKNNSGKGNPMYGKPSPQGAGNGWSGWYKGWFFRSLRELKYVLNLDSKGIPWKSAETKVYQVSYINPMGRPANYFPDFVVGKKIVECKPKKLWNTPTVQAKTRAAKNYFSQIGLEFELIDPGKFDEKQFKFLLENGIIKLTEKYRTLYEDQQGIQRSLDRA